MASCIKEFGFRQPIVVDPEYVVVAGHTRLLASQKLGLSEVPVHVAEGLTDQQIKAFRLADNRTAEESEWDMELLKLELEEISHHSTTGFNEDELAEILKQVTEGLTDPDETPPVPDQSFFKDLIELGNHRLVCGDATNKDHVELALGGINPMLMCCDPPDAHTTIRRGLSRN